MNQRNVQHESYSISMFTSRNWNAMGMKGKYSKNYVSIMLAVASCCGESGDLT